MSFEQQINDFENYGIFEYSFDEAGNVLLNASSSIFQQHHLALNLRNFDYNQNKIQNFYNPEFQEFKKSTTVPSQTISQELQYYISNINKENEDLRSQLDNLINSIDSKTQIQANEQSIKDIILQLRIALKQGKIASDFYTTFPYLPLSVSDAASGETTIEEAEAILPETISDVTSKETTIKETETALPKITSTNLTTLTQTSNNNISINNINQTSDANNVATKLTDAQNPNLPIVQMPFAPTINTPKWGFTVNNIVETNQVIPLITNQWTSGLQQYKVYDNRRKDFVVVVKDPNTGYYLDRNTSTYYKLIDNLTT